MVSVLLRLSWRWFCKDNEMLQTMQRSGENNSSAKARVVAAGPSLLHIKIQKT